jgi:hypothetical protein
MAAGPRLREVTAYEARTAQDGRTRDRGYWDAAWQAITDRSGSRPERCDG